MYIHTNEFTEFAEVLVCDVHVSRRIVSPAASENFPGRVVLTRAAALVG